MTKKKDHGIHLAAQMAATWSPEVLLSKKAEDLIKAYGISRDNALHVLRQEKKKRRYL